MLLGILQVSILHNIVHLLFGVAGLAQSRTGNGACNYLVWSGDLSSAFMYGLIVDQGSAANFVPLTLPTTSFGIGMIVLGLALTRRSRVVNGMPAS